MNEIGNRASITTSHLIHRRRGTTAPHSLGLGLTLLLSFSFFIHHHLQQPMSPKLTTAAVCLAAFTAFSSSAVASPSAQEAAVPLHLPLVRRKISPRSINDFASVADSIRSKYGRPAIGSSSKKRQNTANIDMTNQQADSSYFAPISVGTPCVIYLGLLPLP